MKRPSKSPLDRKTLARPLGANVDGADYAPSFVGIWTATVPVLGSLERTKPLEREEVASVPSSFGSKACWRSRG